ncbi:hypothetical protein D3C72_1452550 [compost metagenome]
MTAAVPKQSATDASRKSSRLRVMAIRAMTRGTTRVPITPRRTRIRAALPSAKSMGMPRISAGLARFGRMTMIGTTLRS